MDTKAECQLLWPRLAKEEKLSHYSHVKTKISDQECLLKALTDLGFGKDKVKVHETAQKLEGYQGDKRQQTAEVIIPRKYVQSAANDIGFKKQADGTFQAYISDYDKSKYNNDWLGKLSQRYAYHKLKEEVESGGLYIESESEEKGEIFLTISTPFGG
jgi:hypothetical protein